MELDETVEIMPLQGPKVAASAPRPDDAAVVHSGSELCNVINTELDFVVDCVQNT